MTHQASRNHNQKQLGITITISGNHNQTHQASRRYECSCMRKPYAMTLVTSSKEKMARYTISHLMRQAIRGHQRSSRKMARYTISHLEMNAAFSVPSGSSGELMAMVVTLHRMVSAISGSNHEDSTM